MALPITTTLNNDANKLVASRTIIDFPFHATQVVITYEAQATKQVQSTT